MSLIGAASRACALVAAVAVAGSIAGTAPAWAHVHASSPGAVRGNFAMVTFEVPNESPTGSATTELTVTLPDVAAARTETKPGWTARLDRDAKTGVVRSVTWTAAPGAGIGADQFGLFQIKMKLPDTETVDFPRRRAMPMGPWCAGTSRLHPAAARRSTRCPRCTWRRGLHRRPNTMPSTRRRRSRQHRHRPMSRRPMRRAAGTPTTPPGCSAAPRCWSPRWPPQSP